MLILLFGSRLFFRWHKPGGFNEVRWLKSYAVTAACQAEFGG
jgi:hypothetical protein